ncbi:gene transfer agent family protein [Stappia sp. ES.058]|uniref:gene transfer agent family protein n=1 Tax=Stappia sp. ES.058 TaxID=1881061 RepID=UPI00087B2EC4|nr:gene transfer agent family protein [Stappia sp. ES.058]SDT99033.1 Phage tail tube protein, GTA-gp10 [Stappia sp. ES.058]
MTNLHRGEVSAVLGGRGRTLVLTLGALAELESAFASADLSALAERFGQGRFSAHDLARIIGAGLRGAGEDIDDDTVLSLSIDGGLPALTRVAARLLHVTFCGDEDASTGAQEAHPPANP